MLLLHTMLLIRAFIGCILLLSGIGKVLDPVGTRRAVSDYGVPLPWRVSASRWLPLLELTIGAGLVLQLVPGLFSSAALLAFLLFLIGVGRALSRGMVMDCHCFGALTREPIGVTTLIRLILFILLTGAIVVMDLSLVTTRGITLVAPGLGTPVMLIPTAITASMGAVGLLVLRQLVTTWRVDHRANWA